MISLLLVVVILVALAYMWRTTNTPDRGNSSFNGPEDPFKGRHTTPPPKSSNHTIDKGSMTRCHNCSCFFPESQVVREVVEGHILEFCSSNCKNSFHVPRSS